VENSVFEQLSCARLEQFWIEWRNKVFEMAKELRETQVYTPPFLEYVVSVRERVTVCACTS
jgi:hypothetical protein